MQLTVSKLAGRVGLSPDALRYYERTGLIPPPERSRAGYRLYEEHMVERLQFIKGAQRMGLKLRQIRELLGVTDRGLCPCGHTGSMLDERIRDIDQEMTQLRSVRTQLVALRDALPASVASPQTSDPWPCAQAFIQAATRSNGKDEDHG